MSNWIGLLGILIGIFSPAAGVLFLIPASGKTFIENISFSYKFIITWLIICVFLYFINVTDIIQTFNLILGAGLSSFLLFTMIKKEYQLNIIFMILLLFNSIYIIIRQLLFSSFIISQYNQAVDDAVKIVSSRFQENTEQYQIFLEMIDISKNFYVQYSPGIWISTMMLCLIIGYYYFSRKRVDMTPVSEYQTHVYIIYSLIIALVIALFTQFKLYAINYLIALVPLFLIQGIAVINSRVGKWFTNSKALTFIAVLSLILNPYIVLFISVIGLFDNWFDFRNISKSEDLNENNSN